MPAVPIRLSVPIEELGWHRHSWLLVPFVILAISLVVELVVGLRLGFGDVPAFALQGVGIAVFVGALTYMLVRSDMSGLCEVATLHDDRVVLLQGRREISLPWSDLRSIRHGWAVGYWMLHPVRLRCCVNGRDVQLCFFPRRDPEFHRWALGSPHEALLSISGCRDRLTPSQTL
jgi:hypothetical protein